MWAMETPATKVAERLTDESHALPPEVLPCTIEPFPTVQHSNICATKRLHYPKNAHSNTGDLSLHRGCQRFDSSTAHQYFNDLRAIARSALWSIRTF